MKAQFLKIAKVKDEKAFYKKYPTEAAFFKAHPEAKTSIKKAQIGTYIGGERTPSPKPISYQDMYDEVDKELTGTTAAERLDIAEKQAAIAAAAKGSGGGGGMGSLSSIMGMAQKALGGSGEGGGSVGEGIMSSGGFGAIGGGIGSGGISGGRNGKYIPRAQVGIQTTGYTFGNQPAWGMQSLPSGVSSGQPAAGVLTGGTQISASQAANQPVVSNAAVNTSNSGGSSSLIDSVGQFAGPAAGVIKGFEAIQKQRNAMRAAKQAEKVSGLALQAEKSKTNKATISERKYVRPEDNITQAGQMFPTYGVGTNVLARNGNFIKRAQDGTIETPQIDGAPTDWYEEGMDRDTYYALKKQLDDAGYQAIPKPETVNVRDMQAITEEQPDPNQMSEEEAAAFMEMYNRDQGKSTETFDSNSARDVWVYKTGLPWSEAKRLGYTSGSAKDNIKLLNELKDPRFRKENLRAEPPKKSSQARTPVQHRETPTGKLAPIKKPLTVEEYFKYVPNTKYTKNAEFKQSTTSSYDREKEYKRQQAEHDDYLLAELPLYYMANPSKLIGDIKNYFNPGFTREDETSEAFRKQVMANRYNKNISSKQRSANHRQMGYNLLPDAAINVATILSGMPYTTFEALPIGIGQGAARTRAAGYVGQGAARLNQAAPKMLKKAVPRMLKQPFTPNFVMYEDGGEIQNTYAPGYLYDGLGYEPLNDSNVKQYYHGGGIPRAQGGFSSVMNAGGTDALSGMVGQGFDNNAGYQIGAGVGNIVKMIPGVGSVIGAVAAPVLGAIGGAIDNIWGDGRATKNAAAQAQRNMESISNMKTASGIHAANTSVMEDGGWVSHDWQPQVITQFGGLDQQDFYDYAHDGMQSLRAGGHIRGEYTPISNRGMQQYAMGGEVQTTWGGHAETISHNPYMPGTGETIMFRGKSHDESDGNGNTGIGVKYGKGKHDSYTDYAEYGTQGADADVEVERGEPAAELEDANGEKNLTVYGNLKIPNQYIDLLGDKNAKGKKFKNYIAEISKDEAKQNKIIEASTNKLNALDPQTQFDKLKLTSLQASIQGANMKLKDIADKKINAARLQNAINDTAEENGLVADDLAKGKVKFDKKATDEYAKYGKSIRKAQKGDKVVKGTGDKWDYVNIGDSANPDWQSKEAYYSKWIPKVEEAYSNEERAKKILEFINRYQGTDAEKVRKALSKFPTDKAKIDFLKQQSKTGEIGIIHNLTDAGIQATEKTETKKEETKKAEETKKEEDKIYPVEAEKRNPWVDLAGQILPFFRPSDQEAFDIAQLYPEMYALSSNQLEPVQAQGYQPDLGTPYDISYQDQLNANQADYNSMQKMVGYNPAAQSILNAQKYAANTGVLGEQFRANQAMQMGVYDQNRQTLNDAKLKNLAIYDQQYERQEQAKSNTKAVTQAALNSIADKYAKNKLENRELGIYENLYNYRYDPSGRAINMNAPWQPNVPNVYNKGNQTPNMRAVYDQNGNFLRWERIEKTETTPPPPAATPPIVAQKKNGGSTKSKNGSIVSAYKNL